MDVMQIIEDARKELNIMADRCRDMAQDLEEIADRLPRPAIAGTQNTVAVRAEEFNRAVERALENIRARSGKEGKHE